jgi:multidrug efflux pump subunit AcrA (membrane-fusion protein)
VCAVIFSSTLLVTVYAAIYTWATDKWATAGLVGFAVFSTITLRRTAAESMSGLKTLISHVASKKVRNGLILLTLVLLSIFVRWELKIPADFTILAQQEFIVRAQTAGVITEVLARENMRVKKDEALARTQDFEKESTADRIAGDIRQKKTTLERLRSEPRQQAIDALQSRIDAKIVELENVRKNQQERRELEEILSQHKTRLGQLEYEASAKKLGYEQGVYAEIIWKEAQNNVDVQHHLIEQDEAKIKALDERTGRQSDLLTKEIAVLRSDMALLKAGPGPQVIRETQDEIRKLESQLKLLNDEVGKREIRAPIDGTVATPFPERKLFEKLAVGAEFIRLVDTAGVTVEMLVPEKELGDVEEGFVVWFKARGLPREDFAGRVDEIAPVAQTVNGQQMIAIRTHLSEETGMLKPGMIGENGKLKSGMTGKARIYCGKRRIIEIMTRRMIRWVKIDFLHLLP